MRVENWEKDLQKEFSDSKNPVQTKNDSSAFLLITLAVLMAAAFFVVGNQKKNGQWMLWIKGKIPFINKKESLEKAVSPPKENNEISEMRSEIMRLRSDLQEMKSGQDENWAKAWDRIKHNHNRIVLLGTLHNENWVIMKNGYNRGDIIFFNHDWTIGKMPQYIRVSPEDREFLEKYVRT